MSNAAASEQLFRVFQNKRRLNRCLQLLFYGWDNGEENGLSFSM